MTIGLDEASQRKLLALCFELVASVSPGNLAKRGERLPDTLVSPFAIRELSDLLEEWAPGAAQKIRDAVAERNAAAAIARHEQQVARARQIDAERHAAPVDQEARRALPKYR